MLASSLSDRAEYFVTRDAKLWRLGSYAGMRIVFLLQCREILRDLLRKGEEAG